jgi:esterase/lipase superfamily enzyme
MMNDGLDKTEFRSEFSRNIVLYLTGLTLFLILSACAGNKPYEINLMPAPDVYEKGKIDPFGDKNPIKKIPYSGILYATDRLPTTGEKHFYLNERGYLLRLGVGRVEVGQEDVTWEEARRISLLKNRSEKYPLRVTGAEEFGILPQSYTVFNPPELAADAVGQAAARFAAAVNDKLAISKRRDIYIYVHGFKVVFENPLLVATELWHFLGYDGVFIAYAWPSTPSNLAYISDAETAALSSRNLRKLLLFLAENTDVERIHIVGYSAGTRVVVLALDQLALQHADDTRTDVKQALRIGHVILVGSDFDRAIFGAYLDEGLLKVPATLSVYVSEKDKALGFSRWLFRRERLGQMPRDRNIDPAVREYLRNTQRLIFIDVTNAAAAATGNGHAYFRKSPWASSDILATLMYDLRPDQRGLVQDSQLPLWTFPEDYIQRLRDVLIEANPDFRQSSEDN